MLDGLNESQYEAVTATEGFVRIIAGAGSGKTKALTHRYAYLVKTAGIHPANILCVTFTSKAAGEMKRRVRKLAGDGTDNSLITTYHGFCARVLREDIGRLFYPENFQILDNHSQKKILEEIYAGLELKLDHANFEKIMDMINKLKATTAYVDDLVSRSGIQFPGALTLDEKIIRTYLKQQKKIFGLDFNDLVNFVFVIFERYPEVRRKWQERLHYIQVDEFQDSSDRELKLINLLSEVNRNLFVVGDPDQNIYEWRGAKVGILVDFDKSHENTRTIIMNQNYRSTGNILGAANSLISNNVNRIKKDLFTAGEQGEPVVHFHAKTENDESMWITETIKELLRNNYQYNNIAVLYRASFLSRTVEQTFMNQHIPYEIVGNIRFFDRMEIADALAYLKLIVYNDDGALTRIINTPRRMFGKTKLEILKKRAAESGASMYETLNSQHNLNEWKNSDIGAFTAAINSIREKYKTQSLTDTINDVLVKSGYEQYIRESGNMERFENLCEFKKIAAEMESGYGEDMRLEEFLRQISLLSDRDDDITTNTVKLMTIHAAKGLEFPACFVIGMSEGIFPSGRTLEERKQPGLEEERRLCFVAATRAMKRLYFTDSEGVNQSGQKKTPSRFLFELGENNCAHIGEIPEEIMEDVKNTIKTPSEANNKTNGRYNVGDKVVHIIFGNGEIVNIDPKLGSYMIKFEKTGNIKPISADYNFDAPEQIQPKETPKDITAASAAPAPDPPPAKPAPEQQRFNIEPVKDVPESKPAETKPAAPKRNAKTAPDGVIPENLWTDPAVPHEGWICSDIIDLGAPEGICKMCGRQIIRYVHMMAHPAYPRKIGAGCVCAGKMEGDPEAAKSRESEYKKRQSRLKNFMSRKRLRSKNGNEYIKYKDDVIVILKDKFKPDCYKTAFMGKFSAPYGTAEDALLEAFQYIDSVPQNK